MFEQPTRNWFADGDNDRPAALRVLLAEDTPISAEMMGAMASHLGIVMDIAANGLEAIAMIEAASAADKPYTLLLLDMMMPILDGVETATRLRQMGYSADQLPIIAVTAATSLDEVRAYRASGMQAFLEKPVSMDDLKATLKAWGHGTNSRKRKPPAATMESLKQQFHDRNIITLARIEDAVAARRTDEEIVLEIKNLLHQIAGTAATFGNPRLSDVARHHENQLVAALFAGGDISACLDEARKSLKESV